MLVDETQWNPWDWNSVEVMQVGQAVLGAPRQERQSWMEVSSARLILAGNGRLGALVGVTQ